MARSVARQAAMMLLYQRSTGADKNDETMALISSEIADGRSFSEDDLAFIDGILEGVGQQQTVLDERIAAHSSDEWTLDRVALVDLCILRLAVFELYNHADVPDNVCISEAMELAARYAEPKTSRYINGVLGAIERTKRKDQSDADSDRD